MLVLVRRLITVVVPLVLGVVVVLPSTSWAALNAYLKLPDCSGPVTAAGLAGAIQLNGFTSKAINTTSIGSGGAGAGGDRGAAEYPGRDRAGGEHGRSDGPAGDRHAHVQEDRAG